MRHKHTLTQHSSLFTRSKQKKENSEKKNREERELKRRTADKKGKIKVGARERN